MFVMQVAGMMQSSRRKPKEKDRALGLENLLPPKIEWFWKP